MWFPQYLCDIEKGIIILFKNSLNMSLIHYKLIAMRTIRDTWSLRILRFCLKHKSRKITAIS